MGLVCLLTFTIKINHSCRWIYHKSMDPIWYRSTKDLGKHTVSSCLTFLRRPGVPAAGRWPECQDWSADAAVDTLLDSTHWNGDFCDLRGICEEKTWCLPFFCVSKCTWKWKWTRKIWCWKYFLVYTHINGFVFSGDICSFYQGKSATKSWVWCGLFWTSYSKQI